MFIYHIQTDFMGYCLNAVVSAETMEQAIYISGFKGEGYTETEANIIGVCDTDNPQRYAIESL